MNVLLAFAAWITALGLLCLAAYWFVCLVGFQNIVNATVVAAVVVSARRAL